MFAIMILCFLNFLLGACVVRPTWQYENEKLRKKVYATNILLYIIALLLVALAFVLGWQGSFEQMWLAKYAGHIWIQILIVVGSSLVPYILFGLYIVACFLVDDIKARKEAKEQTL